MYSQKVALKDKDVEVTQTLKGSHGKKWSEVKWEAALGYVGRCEIERQGGYIRERGGS